MNKKAFYIYFAVICGLILAVSLWYAYWADQQYQALLHPILKTKVDPKSLPADLLSKYTNKAAILEYEAERVSKKLFSQKTSVERDNEFRIFFRLGGIRKLLNDYQGAAEAWIRAGELAPENSAPFANLADLYTYFLKDYSRAEKAYLAAIDAFPNVSYYRALADFYRIAMPNDLGRPEEVILQALKVFPDHEDLISYLAVYFKDIGERDNAIKYYEDLLKINPNHPSVRQDLDRLRAGQ